MLDAEAFSLTENKAWLPGLSRAFRETNAVVWDGSWTALSHDGLLLICQAGMQAADMFSPEKYLTTMSERGPTRWGQTLISPPPGRNPRRAALKCLSLVFLTDAMLKIRGMLCTWESLSSAWNIQCWLISTQHTPRLASTGLLGRI